MVYVSYIVETEVVNANNKKKVYALSSNVAVRGEVYVVEVYDCIKVQINALAPGLW